MYIIYLNVAMAQGMVEVETCEQVADFFQPECSGEVIVECFETEGMPEVANAWCIGESETVAMESRLGDYWDALTLGVREAWDRTFGCYTCDELASYWTNYCMQHGLFVGGFMCVEDWRGCAEEGAIGQCTSSYEDSVVLSPDDW